jgi:hypothetical protein
VLLLVASWWLLQTDSTLGIVGPSIALVGLAVVAASILRGMHVPLGLWPEGPWRARFSLWIVAAVALGFALVVVATDPEAESLTRPIDRGMFLIVMTGVAAWGFAWAFVRQRGALAWYGVAFGAALVPVVVGIVVIAIQGRDSTTCLLSARGDLCDASAVEALGFTLAVHVAAVLVTLELTFRRLLVGQPERAGLVLILVAAALFGAWTRLIGAEGFVLGPPVWLGTLSAVGAGCAYALSRSLLVSSVYTASVFAGYQALVHGVPRLPEGGTELTAFGWTYPLVHLGIVVVGAVAVARRRGLLTGIT